MGVRMSKMKLMMLLFLYVFAMSCEVMEEDQLLNNPPEEMITDAQESFEDVQETEEEVIFKELNVESTKLMLTSDGMEPEIYEADAVCERDSYELSEKIFEMIKCSEDFIAFCHRPNDNPKSGKIIFLKKKTFQKFLQNEKHSSNYIIGCKDIDHLRERRLYSSTLYCPDTCLSTNLPTSPEKEEIIKKEPPKKKVVIDKDDNEKEEIIKKEPPKKKVVIDKDDNEKEEIIKEEPPKKVSGQYDFRTMNKSELKNICSRACGGKRFVSVRNFYQLRKKYIGAKATGLFCGDSSKVKTKSTPCHKRNYYRGISSFGLAPEKTEVHSGSWASQRGAIWCISYHEEDYPSIKVMLKMQNIVPGQIQCGDLVDPASI
jgi:hypothetical protein